MNKRVYSAYRANGYVVPAMVRAGVSLYLPVEGTSFLQKLKRTDELYFEISLTILLERPINLIVYEKL